MVSAAFTRRVRMRSAITCERVKRSGVSLNLTRQCFRKIDLPVTCGSMSPATWCHIGHHRQFITGLPKTFRRHGTYCVHVALYTLLLIFCLSFFHLVKMHSKHRLRWLSFHILVDSRDRLGYRYQPERKKLTSSTMSQNCIANDLRRLHSLARSSARDVCRSKFMGQSH